MNEFRRGYWKAVDEILIWVNSQDTDSVKEFRRSLVIKLLDMRPDERRTAARAKEDTVCKIG